jgi:hypothetical protein
VMSAMYPEGYDATEPRIRCCSRRLEPGQLLLENKVPAGFEVHGRSEDRNSQQCIIQSIGARVPAVRQAEARDSRAGALCHMPVSGGLHDENQRLAGVRRSDVGRSPCRDLRWATEGLVSSGEGTGGATPRGDAWCQPGLTDRDGATWQPRIKWCRDPEVPLCE